MLASRNQPVKTHPNMNNTHTKLCDIPATAFYRGGEIQSAMELQGYLGHVSDHINKWNAWDWTLRQLYQFIATCPNKREGVLDAINNPTSTHSA